MNMSLGQVLTGAGAVGRGWRVEEEAQRVAQENQLKIEEQNRLNRLRQEMAQAPMVQAPNLMYGATTMPVQDIPVAQPPVAAQPAPAAAPTAEQAQLERIKKGNILPQGSLMPQPAPTAAQQSEMDRYARMRQNLPTNVVGGVVAKGLNAVRDFIAPGLAPTNMPPGMVTPKPGATIPAKPDGKLLTPSDADYWLVKRPAGQNDNSLAAAQRQIESGNNATAVSPKGAIGIMQVMPATAMDPGYGLQNIFDFAANMGYTVKGRTEKEAKALLNDPQVGGAFGDMYMNSMLQRYGGNTTYALAAYNMGPQATDKWISQGADVNKLPKETRDYIPKVMAAAGQKEQPTVIPNATVTPDGNVLTAATKVATPTQQKKVSDFYLANPDAVSGDMQRAMRQREELVRLAGMYQRSGIGDKYMELRMKVMEMDEGMFYLQGMQGIQEFTYGNDPRRLSAVTSHFAGAPVAFQPRTDGKYNVFYNGQMTMEALDPSEVADLARRSFDSGYRQTMAQVSSDMSIEQRKTELKMAEDNSKQFAETVRAIAVENIKGTNSLNVEKLKAMNFDVKPSGSGDGTVIITPPAAFGGVPHIYNPTGRTIEHDGVKLISMSAVPIAGIPSLIAQVR